MTDTCPAAATGLPIATPAGVYPRFAKAEPGAARCIEKLGKPARAKRGTRSAERLLSLSLPIPANAGPRAVLEAQIEHLIEILDCLDGDPDLEDNGDYEPSIDSPEGNECELDTADNEPSLGSLDRAINQERWSECNAFNGDGDRELDRADFEPSLGSLDGHIDQTGWAGGDRLDHELGGRHRHTKPRRSAVRP